MKKNGKKMNKKKRILTKLRHNGYAVTIDKRGHFFATKGDEKFYSESLNGLLIKVFGEFERINKSQ